MGKPMKCKRCGAKLTFGPRSYFKKFCNESCRQKYHTERRPTTVAKRLAKSRTVTFEDRRIARYGKDVEIALTSVEAAWLAGIWDGEGTIGIRRARSVRNGIVYEPYLKVANTNPALVQVITNLLGKDNVYLHASKPYKPQHKVCFHLDVRIRAAKYLLNLLRPFLVGKQQQADLVLQFMKVQHEALVAKPNTELCEQLYVQCGMLNQRGRVIQ